MNECEITIIGESETAQMITDEIRNDLQTARTSILKACVRIAQVRNNKLYKALGCRNFEEYCEDKLGIKRNQGFKYATIGTMLNENVSSTIHFESFQQLNVEKLYLIAKAEEPVREEISRAVDLNNTTVKELKARIAELEKQNKHLENKIDDGFERLEKAIQANRGKPSEVSADMQEVPEERTSHPLKPSFILFCDYIHDITKLSMEERGELFTAIMYYTNNLPVPEISRSVGMVFGIIKRQIDRDYEKWLKIKEERTEAGKNGGLATQENNRKNQAIAKANAKAVNVNVNENVSVNANDNLSSFCNDSENLKKSENDGQTDDKKQKHINLSFGEVLEKIKSPLANMSYQNEDDLYYLDEESRVTSCCMIPYELKENKSAFRTALQYLMAYSYRMPMEDREIQNFADTVIDCIAELVSEENAGKKVIHYYEIIDSLNDIIKRDSLFDWFCLFLEKWDNVCREKEQKKNPIKNKKLYMKPFICDFLKDYKIEKTFPEFDYNAI